MLLESIPPDQITHRFLVMGVAIAAIAPRLPRDRQGWTTGGDLSSGFRKLLLCIAISNVIRMMTLSSHSKESFLSRLGDVLGVLEVTGLTLLCFLTAYALQHGLSHYFNIRPGHDLKFPLGVACMLSFAGVTFSRTVHPNFWALKKLANAVSSPPVISTLKSHNSFTTSQSHGRGFIIGQTLLSVEYWHMGIQLCCALSYVFNRKIPKEDQTGIDILMKAIRESAFLADWTRVLVHAIFLNQMDEMYQLSAGTTPQSASEQSSRRSDPDQTTGNRFPEAVGMVPLSRRV